MKPSQCRDIGPSSYDTVVAPEDVTIPAESDVLPPIEEPEPDPSCSSTYPSHYGPGGHSHYHHAKGPYPPHHYHHYPHAHTGQAASPAQQPPDPASRSGPLRLVHVGPNLVRGGAEQWFIDLARFFDPKRVQVVRSIATDPYAVDPDFVADLRVPVEIGQADSVRRAVQQCDVLLAWGVGLNDWLADCRPGLCVVVVHGDSHWNRLYLEECAQVVDHVVAVSHSVKLRNCRGYPTSVIYNGVDAARLARTGSRELVRTSLGFGADDFVLGFVGRFAPEKRAHIVIEALSGLPRHFKALFVGWGDDRQRMLELANDTIPGRSAFATAWSYLGDYYQAMDAFCLASIHEGFSLAMLEAMLCGVPLVVTPVGGAGEILRDRVNALVVQGDAASIRDAAVLLRARPEWARGLAREAQAFAERYGHARRMARDYENLLEGLWGEKYRAPTEIG